MPSAGPERHQLPHAKGALLGTQLEPRALAELAYNAGPGWRDAWTLAQAVAVCLAESWGYTKARCDNFVVKNGEVVVRNGEPVVQSRDTGLWEINIPAARIGTSVEASLYDPATNAHAAYALWSKRGFQPWVSFNHGYHLRSAYMSRSCKAVGNFLGVRAMREAQNTGQALAMPTPLLDFTHNWKP